MSISKFLEIPDLDNEFPFRSFNDYGLALVYPHWHKEVEFIYVIKGSIQIGVHDDLVQVDEGEIYFFTSGQTHYILAAPGSERLVYQFDTKLFFEQDPLKTKQESLKDIFNTRENFSRNWSNEVEQEVSECLAHLHEEVLEKETGYLFQIQRYLYELVGLFGRKVPKKMEPMKKALTDDSMKNKETLERMDKIFAYIEDHYNTGVTLEEVAKHIGFSPHYFTRFFKKNTGTTFVGFLTEYRLTIAKSILGTEDLPMVEVAEKSGFNSVKTFHHVFKENVGMSPLKYQKSISGN